MQQYAQRVAARAGGASDTGSTELAKQTSYFYALFTSVGIGIGANTYCTCVRKRGVDGGVSHGGGAV